MEKNENNGFESRELYERVNNMINTAMFALADTTMVEFIEATQVIGVYVGYDDITLEMTLNMFDGLCSVVKTDDDGEDIAYMGKRDLDIIRRMDAICHEVIYAVYRADYDDEEE